MRDIWQRFRPHWRTIQRVPLIVRDDQMWERVRVELTRPRSSHGPSSLAFLAASGYRTALHRHGVEAGESLLERFADAVAEHCRVGDTLARLRPGELGLFMPAADAECAGRIMALARARFDDLCSGVVTWSDTGVPLQAIAQAGYQAMYEAERSRAQTHRQVVIVDGAPTPYVPASAISRGERFERTAAGSSVPAWRLIQAAARHTE